MFAELLTATQGLSFGRSKKEKLSIDDINNKIFRQLKKLGDLITAHPINEEVEKYLDDVSKQKKVKTGSEYDKYFNEAQEIKIYLSYYLNKLNRSGSRQLSTLSTTQYRENPYESLIDGLKWNEEELTQIEKLLKTKTGGKRRKTRRNKRRGKRKTQNKRKGRKKTRRNKRKPAKKHRKTR